MNRDMNTLNFLSYTLFGLVVICMVLIQFTTAKKLNFEDGDCEVCIKSINKFVETLSDDEKSDFKKIEDSFRTFCKKAKGKEERFCYYVGGLSTSATGMLNELSKPISWHMPAEKICEKLNKKDSQICELKTAKEIDLTDINFKKLKVKDLKKILSDWDEQCKGCAEKADFIRRIEELMPEHAPEAYKKRQEKQEL